MYLLKSRVDSSQPQTNFLIFQHIILWMRTRTPHFPDHSDLKLRYVRAFPDRPLDALCLLLIRPVGLNQESIAVSEQKKTQVRNCYSCNHYSAIWHSTWAHWWVNLQSHGYQLQRVRYFLVYFEKQSFMEDTAASADAPQPDLRNELLLQSLEKFWSTWPWAKH